jgi:biopolymer transport protein ExbB
MFDAIWTTSADLMQRGGFVMWPLLLLSIVGLTLIFERCWFWFSTNSPWRVSLYERIGQTLRAGDREQAITLLGNDRSVFGNLVRQMLAEGSSDATAIDAVENQRRRMERFMPTLSTIITAGPMLGILGTVTGIISAFRILADETVTDPSKVGGGIAEALLTTVAGLIVALIVLFPYNAFRAQIDRALGRMEALIAAATHLPVVKSKASGPHRGPATAEPAAR